MPEESKGPTSDNVLFERRKFIRVKGTFVVSYTDSHEPQPKSDITQTQNISVGGILIRTDRNFPKDTILDIKLKLPDYPEYINVKVQVVDCKQRVKNMIYDTRAKFLNIKDEHKDAINKIVEYSFRKGRQAE